MVAPSHVLVLWSRVRNFRASDLDRLLWDEKMLFEHWSHAVSLEIGETIEHLAEFLGAKEVVYTARVPNAWKNSLR